MFSFSAKGDFRATEKALRQMSQARIEKLLAKYGQRGVEALRSATPVESGATALGWYYEIDASRGSQAIHWMNSHVVDGAPIAILLQYGHGTGTGGYVKGRDYINPAIQPVFDQIADEVWKAVTSA